MASSYVPSSSLGALSMEYDFDSLPYIDGNEIDLSYARQLIAEEMRTFQPKNYLKNIPLPELKFERSERWQREMKRVKEGKSNIEKLDMSRYQVAPPPNALNNDVQAWKDAVNNAKSQVHTHTCIYIYIYG